MYYTNEKNYSSLKQTADDSSGTKLLTLTGLLVVIIGVSLVVERFDDGADLADGQQLSAAASTSYEIE